MQTIGRGLGTHEEDDPNAERSSKVKRHIFASLTCYVEMLKERSMKAPRHQWILSFKQKMSGLDASWRPPATDQLSSCLVQMKTPSTCLALLHHLLLSCHLTQMMPLS
jgi:hypothetical protein